MAPKALYDVIGKGYRDYRMPEPAIRQAIQDALSRCQSVINVGAGSGSYEPTSLSGVAVELSERMIAQRVAGQTWEVVQGSANQLPLIHDAADASLAILTLHHWSDQERGLAEMARVSRDRVVILTWDPSDEGFWLTRDYFPDLLAIDRKIFPTLPWLSERLGEPEVHRLLIPHDCRDGFLGAYWRRPEAYLSNDVRGAISTFCKIDRVEERIAKLEQDLEAGIWQERNAHLLRESTWDLGYRLLVFSSPFGRLET